MKFYTVLLPFLAMVPLTGCGAGPGSQSCPATFALTVSPSAGTADHMAAAPGNQQQFIVTGSPGPPVGCVENNVVSSLQWRTSDPANVQISSAPASNGLATCVGRPMVR